MIFWGVHQLSNAIHLVPIDVMLSRKVPSVKKKRFGTNRHFSLASHSCRLWLIFAEGRPHAAAGLGDGVHGTSIRSPLAIMKLFPSGGNSMSLLEFTLKRKMGTKLL
jgi:hypothetical protein